MTERNLYLVDFEVIRQRFNHRGIYGKGRDIILDIPSTIHILQDKFVYPGNKEGKLISMQIFAGLSTELLQRKLDQLTKACYQFYVPYYQSVLMISYKKNEDKTFDLMILYDFENMIPLVDIIREKKENNQVFSEQEVWDIIYILLDSMYMGSSLSYEYTDISPVNIFMKEQAVVLSNFGLQLPRKLDKCVQCQSDQFYTNKLSGKQTVMELYTSSYMFKVGMIALYLLTLEEPNTLYLDFNNQETKKINNNLLQKRIDSVQESGVSNQLLNWLNQALNVREDERLTISELYTEEGSSILRGEVTYYQGPLADAKKFSGFVETKGNEKIPHGMGDITTNEDQNYIGMFNHGKIDGNGIWFDGKKKFAFGKWEDDVLKEGMLINKNEYLFYGSISNFEPAAVGILINVAANVDASYFYFEGTFNENNLPAQGQTFLKNGNLVPGVPPQSQQEKLKQQDNSNLIQKEKSIKEQSKQSIEFEEQKQKDSQ